MADLCGIMLGISTDQRQVFGAVKRRVMRIKIETNCSLPDKKYNLGWSMGVLPELSLMWITEDNGESIDGYRFNTRPAFLIINIAWLFWSASFFIKGE